MCDLNKEATLMDVLSTDWLHELEMEDSSLLLQRHVDLADHSLDEIDFNCFSPEVYSSYAPLNNKSACIQTDILELGHKTNTDNSDNNEDFILFGQSGSPSTHSMNGDLSLEGMQKDDDMVSQDYINSLSMDLPSLEENKNDALETCKRAKRVCAMSRAPWQAKNHILAERKRRERLNQKLISLSALIPGLKKMDKASILEDAIRYIKQLKEHVQTLEKEAKKKMVEPTPTHTTATTTTVLSVKKCQRPSYDDDTVSLDDENLKKLSPKMEVRVSDKNVLVRIQCEKGGAMVAKILSEMPALHLNVVSTSVLPFGNATLDITIIAQVDDEIYLTVMDMEKNLRLAFQNLMCT